MHGRDVGPVGHEAEVQESHILINGQDDHACFRIQSPASGWQDDRGPARGGWTSTSNPLFEGMGDTPEKAVANGLVNAKQVTVLQRQDCTMTILADHSFVIMNLPSADLSKTASVLGTWSIQVYHAFETYGYRITLKCGDSKGFALRAKFFNADKPNPPILDILYDDGKEDSVMFRFANTTGQAASRRSGAR